MNIAPAASEGDASFPLAAGRFLPSERQRLSAPALRTFLSIADFWELTEDERLMLIGQPPRSTYHNWCRLARRHEAITLNVDTLTRLSLVLGIYQGLVLLYGDGRAQVDWLKGPHDVPVFAGQRPLDLMIAGTQDGLYSTRRFIDAARGGLYMPPNALDADTRPYGDDEIRLR